MQSHKFGLVNATFSHSFLKFIGVENSARLPIEHELFSEISEASYSALLSRGPDSAVLKNHLPFREIRLARWKGRFEAFQNTEIESRESSQILDRHPSFDHFDLVWTGRVFEIRQYRVLEKLPRRCFTRRPSLLTESKELTPRICDSSICLSTNDSTAFFDINVIIHFDGIVETQYRPGGKLGLRSQEYTVHRQRDWEDVRRHMVALDQIGEGFPIKGTMPQRAARVLMDEMIGTTKNTN